MSLPPKVDLSAIHRLQFYRKQKDWKLYSHLRVEDDTEKTDNVQNEETSPVAEKKIEPGKKSEKSEFKSNPAESLYSSSKTYVNSSKNKNAPKESPKTQVVVIGPKNDNKKNKTPPRKVTGQISVRKRSNAKIAARKNDNNHHKALDDEKFTNLGSDNNKKENDVDKRNHHSDDNNKKCSPNEKQNKKLRSRRPHVIISRNECFKVIIPVIKTDRNTSVKVDRVQKDNINNEENDKGESDSTVNNDVVTTTKKFINSAKDIKIDDKEVVIKAEAKTNTQISEDKRPEKTTLLNFIKQYKPKFKPELEISKNIFPNNENSTLKIDNNTVFEEFTLLDKDYTLTPTLNTEIDALKDLNLETNTGGINLEVESKEPEKIPVRQHNLPIYAKLSQDEMLLEELKGVQNKIERRIQKRNAEKDTLKHNDDKYDKEIREIASRLAKIDLTDLRLQNLEVDDADLGTTAFEQDLLPMEDFYEYEIWSENPMWSSEQHGRCGSDVKQNPEAQRDEAVWVRHFSPGEYELYSDANRFDYDGTYEEYPTRDVGLNGPQHTSNIDIQRRPQHGPPIVPSVPLFDLPRRPPTIQQNRLDSHHECQNLVLPSFEHQNNAPGRRSSTPFDPTGPPEFTPCVEDPCNGTPFIPPFESFCGPPSFTHPLVPQSGPPNAPPPSPNISHEPPSVTAAFDPRRRFSDVPERQKYPVNEKISLFDPRRPPPNFSTPFDEHRISPPNFTPMPALHLLPKPSDTSLQSFFNLEPGPQDSGQVYFRRGPLCNPSMVSFDPQRQPHSVDRTVSDDPCRGSPDNPKTPILDPHPEPPGFVPVSTAKLHTRPDTNRYLINSDEVQAPPDVAPVSKLNPLCEPFRFKKAPSIDPPFNRNLENEPQQGPVDFDDYCNAQSNNNYGRKNVRKSPINNYKAKNENLLLKYIQDFNEKFLNDETEFFNKKDLNKDKYNIKEKLREDNNNNDLFNNRNTIFDRDLTKTTENINSNENSLKNSNFIQKETPVSSKNINQLNRDIPKSNTYFGPEDFINISPKKNNFVEKDGSDFANNYIALKEEFILKNDNLAQDVNEYGNPLSPREVLISSNNYFVGEDIEASDDEYFVQNVPTVSSEHTSKTLNDIEKEHSRSKDRASLPVLNFLIAKEFPNTDDNNYFAQNETPNNYFEQKDSNTENNNFRSKPGSSFVQNINIIAQKNVSNNIQANVLPVVVTNCVRCDQVGVAGRGRGRLQTERLNLGSHFY